MYKHWPKFDLVRKHGGGGGNIWGGGGGVDDINGVSLSCPDIVGIYKAIRKGVWFDLSESQGNNVWGREGE